jgi:DNA/RNA-binding domain of Phe-tRNA-synthetase-like protein
MTNFSVDSSFWSLFPEARIGLIIARGLDNATAHHGLTAAMTAAMQTAAARLGEADLATHPAIAPWRAAYRAFGAKPSDYRSSIENLLRSAKSGRLRGINPLVDLYNAHSLTHWLPYGGEDLSRVVGDIRLTRAVGDEHFVPLGASEPAPPFAGEVIYRDDIGVLCRGWNWREAERTKLTEATTDAVLVIEALAAHDPAQPERACAELADAIRTHLSGTTRYSVVQRERPEAVDL